MSPLVPKSTAILALLLVIAIRMPHQVRSFRTATRRRRIGASEAFVLLLAVAGLVPPLLWVVSPWLVFADYPLYTGVYAVGVLALALGSWLFYRSHADLGTNWSVTLEIRATHRLVTGGVYRRVRHPMYTAILLLSLGLALVVPNAVAGPSLLVAMLVLLAMRIPPEERMLVEEFGAEYEAYVAQTKRLVPGVW